MPSLQAKLFGPVVRVIMKRKNWGPDEFALTRRTRRILGAPRISSLLAGKAVRVSNVDEEGVRGEWLEPKAGTGGSGVVLYVHGGGFVSCSPATHRPITAAMARATRLAVFAIDYRLAPEHRFPAGLDDVVAAYRWLRKKYPSEKIAVVGDSAGGGLTLSLCLRLRAATESLPAAIVCFSPWTDLTGSGESVEANGDRDRMFYPKTVHDFAKAYINDESDLTHPLASPVFADLRSFPPALFHIGSTEILVDDARRIHENIIAAGGRSELEVFDGVFHCWQMGAGLIPEADDSFRKAAAFILHHLK